MASLCHRRKKIISLILLLMFIFEMIFAVWARDQSKLFGQNGGIEKNNRGGWEERERMRAWRWKNRNRMRNRRNRLGLNQNQNQNQLNQAGNKLGLKTNRKTFTEIRNLPEQFTYITESIESCCPTIAEIIEPLAGKNRTGHLVNLYQDLPIRQRFYEFSCAEGIMNKPCKFLEKDHSKKSRCTQQHTYTYALVRPDGISDLMMKWPTPDQEHTYKDSPQWTLDYITIRSGCACQVIQNQKKRARNNF